MAENTKRGVFRLNGLTGGIIAVIGLLATLVYLTAWNIQVQQGSATNPYDPTAIRDLHNLKTESTANKAFSFVDVKKD